MATVNILNRRSPDDDRVDVERFAAAIHTLDADVLALQEVDQHQPRSRGADPTTVAAAAMGADEHRFVAALTGTPGGARGRRRRATNSRVRRRTGLRWCLASR